ncbi:MAG: hypothetical protein P8Y23_14320 [Candidatus Lokiarchaeota archaeon]|jgi:hypothetical protein
MNDSENQLTIKKNKFLFIASILMLIYSILEILDSIVITLMILNVLPTLSTVFKFDVLLIQTLLESHPLSLAPIFWAFTLMRIIATIGLFKNLLWGYWIAIISVMITMILAFVFLPFGAYEILACSMILIFLIIGYCEKKPLISQ